MIEQFTVEEVNLICCYGTANSHGTVPRAALIAWLTEAVEYSADDVLIEIAESALRKVSRLTDAEFASLEFFPEYGSEDDNNFEEVTT
ncbi:hypothetical protein FACS1894202_03780 [Clostridia bacterium]|nr:hypothetical protein FACS1894202_03780 [Clostridia bacterium]